jgi:hypothetical protein
MGLLDEAIKEHLELKRRHGADPGEVARLEHEALGPARRDPAPAAIVDEPVAAEAALEPAAHDDPYVEDDARAYDEVPADERLEAPIHHVAPEAAEPERVAQPEPVHEPEPEPEPVVEPEPAEPAAEIEQPTRQFSLEEVAAASQGTAAPAPADAPHEPPPEPPPPAEDVVPADDEPEGDDVLEETPEFLQETPEHDRLWFEQKPPRDFDF